MEDEQAGSPRAEGAGNDHEAEALIRPSKHRPLQAVEESGRRLFDDEAKQAFLENFAASCNVRWAAGRAGFSEKTAYKHRMNDARFREGWGRALEQGYARLQAELLARAAGTVAFAIDGDGEGPAEIDTELALVLLREHARGLAGVAKPGRAPRVASNAEVREALEKGLKAFAARVHDESLRLDGGGREGADGATGAVPVDALTRTLPSPIEGEGK